ncbi:MAG: hypothetical protein ACOZIN_06650 [Myxococcota bacterium]
MTRKIFEAGEAGATAAAKVIQPEGELKPSDIAQLVTLALCYPGATVDVSRLTGRIDEAVVALARAGVRTRGCSAHHERILDYLGLRRTASRILGDFEAMPA